MDDKIDNIIYKTLKQNANGKADRSMLQVSQRPLFTNIPTMSILVQRKLTYVRTYNLEQSKMRNRSTPPPNSLMYSRYNENAPFFPSLKWGEGGLNFSSILSKIVASSSIY